MENQSPLGKTTSYRTEYSPELLFPILRSENRQELGIKKIPFHGVDIWNAYELSWLNEKGKPQIAIGEFWIPATSPYLIESKSLKLYFNSFNQTRFSSLQEVCETIAKDLSVASQSQVTVNLNPHIQHGEPKGICIDGLDIETDCYDVEPSLLKAGEEIVTETLYSELLKSNCLVTGQPDWATLSINYTGHQLDHEALLKYIVSYRNHQGFHEHCVESIFVHLLKVCKPKSLTVYARYTRRGGLDINPFRSTEEIQPQNLQYVRQ